MASSSDSTQMATSPKSLIPTLPVDPLLEPGSFIDADPVAPAAADEEPAAAEEEVGATPKSGGGKKGATAGTVDRYYLDPSSEHRFRSQEEVDYFLQHGTERKKSDGTPDVQPSESPAGGKKKSGSKSRRPTLPPNFDFDDVPEMTTWKLSDPENDVWTPYIV